MGEGERVNPNTRQQNAIERVYCLAQHRMLAWFFRGSEPVLL